MLMRRERWINRAMPMWWWCLQVVAITTATATYYFAGFGFWSAWVTMCLCLGLSTFAFGLGAGQAVDRLSQAVPLNLTEPNPNLTGLRCNAHESYFCGCPEPVTLNCGLNSLMRYRQRADAARERLRAAGFVPRGSEK